MNTFFLAVTFHYKKLTKSGKLFSNLHISTKELFTNFFSTCFANSIFNC
ncbi:hypothetical protein HS9_02063 [Bacillus velezensis]|nr:hypothetical protein HS9_02063 [Bacillus velezensis]